MIAVPMSWPTTMTPTVACRPMSLTLAIDARDPPVSTSTTSLPLLNWSIQLRAAPSRVRHPPRLLPIRIALAWTCFWIFSGS